MKTFFKFFSAIVAVIFFGTGCGTIQGGAGFTSHATVEHYYYQNPQPVYVLPVPGRPDVTTVHVQRWGGDPRIPREEKVTITEYGPTGREVLEQGSAYYNLKAERYHGNTGGRGPTNGYRH